MRPSYQVHFVPSAPVDLNDWDSPLWKKAQVANISQFHPRSSDHHPRAQVRLLHDGTQLLLRFDVEDQYVISQATKFQQSVCLDSCVEFFFKPKSDAGYFNLEINCGGTMLMYYVEDPTYTEKGLAKYTPISAEHASQITIAHSMPAIVFPERADPTHWQIACRIPLALLENYLGPLGAISRQHWTANFYKCADRSSHPHWASWSSIGDRLNFHQPGTFGDLHFE